MKKASSKIKKTSKINTTEENRPKDVVQHDWEKIADILRKSTCLSIERFLINIGISSKIYYEAVNRLDYLKEAHEFALMRMGCDREEMCLNEKLSGNSVAALSLPQFLSRWKSDVEWRSKLKEKEEEKSKIITVEVPVFKKAE